MKCINCNKEIEKDDNFCYKCGHITTKGYLYLKDNPEHIKLLEGNTKKTLNKLSYLFVLLTIFVTLFIGIVTLKSEDIFKPLIYLKKQISSYKYGYNTSIIKTDNNYGTEFRKNGRGHSCPGRPRYRRYDRVGVQSSDRRV